MNDKQKVYSAMSGYEGVGEPLSAGDDYYYDLTNSDEKRKYIERYAYEVLEIALTKSETDLVFNALERLARNSHDAYLIFESLK